MIITRTPLRLALLGGNTDFPKYFKKYGGAGLTATIDKYVYCILKERFDDEIRINYNIKEIVSDIKDIKHDLVREAIRLVNVTKGVEITFLSDIPSEGSGLGSSSAVVIGLLNALHEYKNEHVGARQLAEEACKIEVDILKKPIGYQDQYAIAFGGYHFIEFTKEHIAIGDGFSIENENFMLFYTGITRKTDDVLSKLKLNKKILDKNKALVFNMDLSLGELLNLSWESKKKLNPLVTNKTIDDLYSKAIEAGAIGGKIIGAGGGGFFLFVVPEDKKQAVREALKLKELPFNLSQGGSKVIFQI